MAKENFIFGIRPVIEAIKSGKEVDKVFLLNRLKGEGFRDLFTLIRDLGIPHQFVPVEKLNRLSKQNHQGVIAWLSELTYQKIEEIIPAIYEQGQTPLILILDQVSDVRNIGSIARTAECAGVHALIIPSRGSAQLNSEAIKTSAGALYKLPVCRSQNLKTTIRFLKNSGLTLYAATEKGTNPYTATDYNKPLALIMGSEGTGISEEYLQQADETIHIPVLGEITSLNVSVACGVVLYEIIRQRGQII